MDSGSFGFTLNVVRSLAFQLAERNELTHKFNKNKKMDGKTLLYSFLKRHPDITLRISEPTSFARAMGFDRSAVYR